MIKKNIIRAGSQPTVSDHFRVGNCGYIQADGNIIIGCHRKALARILGLGKEEEGVNPYFEVGRANEQYIQSKLPNKTADYDEIVWEPEWELKLVHDKVTIVGHPDGGFKKDGKFIAGIELKASSSSNSLEDPFLSGIPKPAYLIQAALYSYMSGVPFYLFHKAYTKPTYVKKGFKFEDTEKEFKVYVKDSKIYYDNELGQTIDSGYMMEGILDYYSLCAELIEKEQLYRTPFEEKWDHTRYCKECQVSDKVNGNYQEWIKEMDK